MALNPTLKKITVSVLLVSCINLTVSATVLPAKQFSVQSPVSTVTNSSTEVSKPYSVTLSEVVKTEAVRPDKEKKKKKAIIWIITGAVVVVAIILLSGKKDPAPSGPAV